MDLHNVRQYDGVIFDESCNCNFTSQFKYPSLTHTRCKQIESDLCTFEKLIYTNCINDNSFLPKLLRSISSPNHEGVIEERVDDEIEESINYEIKNSCSSELMDLHKYIINFANNIHVCKPLFENRETQFIQNCVEEEPLVLNSGNSIDCVSFQFIIFIFVCLSVFKRIFRF